MCNLCHHEECEPLKQRTESKEIRHRSILNCACIGIERRRASSASAGGLTLTEWQANAIAVWARNELAHAHIDGKKLVQDECADLLNKLAALADKEKEKS